jgi:hypothetical protein
MRKAIATLCFLLATSPLALAQDKVKKEPSEKQKAQQVRMKDCNAKAKAEGKKGDERKQFMSSCLKGKASAPSQEKTAQKR